jgi:hypothetical protein
MDVQSSDGRLRQGRRDPGNERLDLGRLALGHEDRPQRVHETVVGMGALAQRFERQVLDEMRQAAGWQRLVGSPHAEREADERMRRLVGDDE